MSSRLRLPLRGTLAACLIEPVIGPESSVATAGAALSMLLVSTAAGWPQAARRHRSALQSPAQQSVPARPAPQQPQPPACAAGAEENPGLINELGKLLGQVEVDAAETSRARGDHRRPQYARQMPQRAGDSLSRQSPSTMVSGRAACVVAANGAPDCKAGADRLCQTKGYKEGKSLDTDAAEKCSAKVYIPGRKREPGDCKTENYVIKALCQ